MVDLMLFNILEPRSSVLAHGLKSVFSVLIILISSRLLICYGSLCPIWYIHAYKHEQAVYSHALG